MMKGQLNVVVSTLTTPSFAVIWFAAKQKEAIVKTIEHTEESNWAVTDSQLWLIQQQTT